MIRTFTRIAIVVLSLFIILLFLPVFGPALSGGTRGEHIREQKHFAALFKAGDTNAPLLAMDWFSRGVHYCRVNQLGSGSAALDVGYAREGGGRVSLDETNRLLLIQAINRLPLQSKHFLPQNRQIYISGIRSNQWFQCVYDRGNVPKQVEKLFEITGAYLEWFIPTVGPQDRGFEGQMHWAISFAIAKDAPYAISSCANSGLQIWNLGGWSPRKITVSPDNFPYPTKYLFNGMFGGFQGAITISPDGRVLILADGHDLFAVDWENRKVLWQNNQMAFGNLYHAEGKTLALDNRGQSLYLANGGSIEHWNWANGTKLRTLATNNPSIKFLQTSWNDGFLIAGFADGSFTIWNTDKDEPISHFIEPGGADCMAISPDGKQIVLNSFGQRKLVVYDWQHSERKEFPLRTPYGSLSALSMCWSPDGKRLAAKIDSPSFYSVIIYDADSWKPIADWPSGFVGSSSILAFSKNGRLFQLMSGEINSLDVIALKGLANGGF